MLQIFIRAREDDLKPDIQFLELESSHSLNEWRLLAGHEQSGAPLTFRSDVKFYDLHLEADKSITTPDLNGNLGALKRLEVKVTKLQRTTTGQEALGSIGSCQTRIRRHISA